MDLNHPLLAQAPDEPPPFPPAYPQLQRLDRSVVCPICKEQFSGPVSISCGHSFCSHCIRSWLDSNKKCPQCGESAGEGSIRRNRALEEIADAWEVARPTLITLSAPHPTRRRPVVETTSKSTSSSSNSLKRVRDDRQGSSSRSQSPVKRVREEEEVPAEAGDEVEDELTEADEGECPLCGAKMSIAAIPMHIERGCPPPKAKNATASGSGNQKVDWKKVFSGAGQAKGKEVDMKKITKPNYSLTSPVELRQILQEYGLPTNGDKVTLCTRVQGWITKYNANLDTSHPQSLSALRAKLNAEEAAQRRDREKGKVDAVDELGTKEGMERYAKERKPDFERLRRDILERDKRKKEDKGVALDSPIEVD